MSASSKRQNWIPVVTALIRRKGMVLVGQRPEEKTLPGVWEFPGGKIEAGESPEVALQRELNEELGIQAEIGNLALAATHNYGTTGILLLFYFVDFWQGDLRSVHHTEIKWVSPRELGQIKLPEANSKVLSRIQSALGIGDANRLSL